MAAKKKTIDNRLDEIARIRARFLVLDREASEAERAPLPPAETAERIDAAMAIAASRARLDGLGARLIAAQRRGSIDLTSAIVETLAGRPGNEGAAIPAGSLLAFAMPDQFRAALVELAAETAENHPPPLAASERAERLRLLADERRDLERAEAEACWTIEDAGQAAPWRGDERPEFVLDLEIDR